MTRGWMSVRQSPSETPLDSLLLLNFKRIEEPKQIELTEVWISLTANNSLLRLIWTLFQTITLISAVVGSRWRWKECS